MCVKAQVYILYITLQKTASKVMSVGNLLVCEECDRKISVLVAVKTSLLQKPFFCCKIKRSKNTPNFT